jgi:hypothetical protein
MTCFIIQAMCGFLKTNDFDNKKTDSVSLKITESYIGLYAYKILILKFQIQMIFKKIYTQF